MDPVTAAQAPRASGDAGPPALIALDWGTSSLRGYLMTAAGVILDRRASPHGIQALPLPGRAGFERAFADLCGDWVAQNPGLPVVAGGMVGSAQGWCEAPYVSCPADASRLASSAATVETAEGLRIHIAPGVIYNPADGAPDVIRGEEIQIAGALAASPHWRQRALAVMPGTHSKWVVIADGHITRFVTFMTGEIFALLCRSSILGRLMPEKPTPTQADADAAFDKGVATALSDPANALTHTIFSVRTLGLTQRLAPDCLAEYLSGLLVGAEIAAARTMTADLGPVPLLLIGDSRLCRRYGRALDLAGLSVAAELDNTAPDGLLHFAEAAGLLQIQRDVAYV